MIHTEKKTLFEKTTNVIVAFSLLLLLTRLINITNSGGWTNRADFFVDGLLAPTLIDFIFNEIILYFLIFYTLLIKPKLSILVVITLSSLVYFNRSPLIILIFSLLFSGFLSKKIKIIAISFVIFASLLILTLRIGYDNISIDHINLFLLQYPQVGIGRLLVTEQSHYVGTQHIIALLIKPVDALFFVFDYGLKLNGDLSAGRFIGYEITKPQYIPLLNEYYNAFGTILFPFIYILGWIYGVFFFIIFLIFQYYSYRIVLKSKYKSKKILYLILSTGLLFSWHSPFIWVVPYLFVFCKKQYQKNTPQHSEYNRPLAKVTNCAVAASN